MATDRPLLEEIVKTTHTGDVHQNAIHQRALID